LTREVIGRLEHTGDALANGGIATIVGAEDGALESTRVGDVHVELAVLAVFRYGNARVNRRNIRVENQCDRGSVIGDNIAERALRTVGPTIGNALDLDSGWIRGSGVKRLAQRR